MKYHINEKGEINLCTAKSGNCPFEHFDNKEDARKFYEQVMSNEAFTVIGKTRLNDVMNVELLQNMVKEGYVNTSSHQKDDSFQILNYTPKAQYDGKWNEITKQARGLIIQTSQSDFSDAIILERPWRKFFTLQQLSNGWHLGDEENVDSSDSILQDLDFNAPAEVTDKLDGSMGVSYIDPDGNIALATRGSFHSGQAESFTKFLRENEEMYQTVESMVKENSNTTFIYELVGPDNRIVVNYDKTDITLLGAVDKSSGIYHSPKNFEKWSGGSSALSVTETMNAKTLKEALSLPDRKNKEGLVVRIISDDPEKQHQVKIKQDDYIALHRIATHLPLSRVKENVRNSKVSFSEVFDTAKTGNVRNFDKVNEELETLEKHNLSTHVNDREETYKEHVLPAAKKALDIYEKIQAMDESHFNKKTAIRDFILSYDGPRSEKVLNITFFKSRLEGKSVDEIDAKTFLQSVSSNIKGS